MRFISSFVILFGFWLIWSGKFDAFHLALGLISVLIVCLWSGDYLISDSNKSFFQRLSQWLRFEIYVFWLIKEIVLANIQVVFVALHPKMKSIVTSEMLDFDSQMSEDLPRFILAQSITLTPGTVTVRVNGSRFLVHALTKKIAKTLPGDMPARVSKIFGGKR